MAILNTFNSSIVVSTESGVPEILYFGPRLSDNVSEDELAVLTAKPLAQAGLDTRPVLSVAPTYADGTFMEPALKIHSAGQHWAPQWTLQHADTSNVDLIYKLLDQKSGLLVVWQLNANAATDVLSINVCLENKGSLDLELGQWLTTLPMPDTMAVATSFTGRWVHEFQPEQNTIPIGALEFRNIKGRTSHNNFPGMLIGDAASNEQSGSMYGVHLGWSGNHVQRIERTQHGFTQYQAGVALMPGEVTLGAGATFNAPTLYATYSNRGIAGISEHFQSFVRAEILDFPNKKTRPVHINTWEAIYFNHTQDELDSLAAAAEQCGLERFVLDDGWFVGRRDDTSSLGDWDVDTSIYPDGLHPLAATLKKHNLGFGLWLEPEMVNHESELYRQHPDWVLNIEGLQQSSGRNQWVLDITRDEVQTYLFQKIDALLSEYPIEYIKWDMNRDLLQAGDVDGKAVYFEYVNALYALLAKIRKAHPSVEIESCASGGGRMDYGILKYTHRFWLSDCNDAFERQIMQQWASVFFPAEVLGSHVGPVKSHTTSRSHPLYVRSATAMFGHMGVEWDVRQTTDDEKAELKRYIELYKTHRDLIHSAPRQPLVTPDKGQIGFAIVAQEQALVSLFQQKMPTLGLPGSLKLPFVNDGSQYKITIAIEPEKTAHLMKIKPDWMSPSSAVYSSELLKNVGLPLPVMDPETVLVLHLKKM